MLNRVAERPGLSGVELANMTLTTPQAAHLVLSALEKKGLIVRKLETGAGHIVRSNLTEEGRRVVESCLAEVHKVERRLLAVLTEDEQQALAVLLASYLRQVPHPEA